MKISVTGGTGFVGKKLVEVLSQEGHAICVLTRNKNVDSRNNIQFLYGDLVRKNFSFEKFLEGCDIVFHCAGELHEKEKMRALHVDGTRRLLDAVVQKKKIHWVQLSSVGAYGPPMYPDEDRTVTESTPNRPVGEYEVTKALSDEMVIEAAQSGLMTYSIVRPSNIFGMNMPNQSLRALGKMVRKGLFFYLGKPGAIATYIHVNDVVEVLRLCGFDSRAKGEVFNISNDCLFEDMMEGMACALGVRAPRLRLPESLVRRLVQVVSKLIKTPLTNERIDNLVRRTRYPHTKVQERLGFVPKWYIPQSIGEVLV